MRRDDIVIVVGLVLCGVGYQACQSAGLAYEASATAALTMLCLVWWVFEPIPIPVTALIPIAGFPLLGVLDSQQIAVAVGSPLILLLLGGFLLSRAMEYSGAHRRIALIMVRAFGGANPRRLVFGFMAASAVLSMWISNTATVLMLLPVALAMLDASDDQALAVPLLLGIAYAASIGGMGTPIGTPPNLVFMEVYSRETGESVGFTRWMGWALPVVVLLVPVAGVWLTRNLPASGQVVLPALGPWLPKQKRVLWVFALTALAWMTRQEPFGGWSGWFGLEFANDASVALLAVVVMCLLPDGEGRRLLNWEAAVAIPWGVLLLFAGGIVIAAAFGVSGLSTILADGISELSQLPVVLLVGAIALSVSLLTETTSNTASTTLLMPVLAAAAAGAGQDPLLFMVPAAMSASCAFMLPVATAPNSIVYGSGRLSISTMVREGVVLNLFAALVITVVCLFCLT